MVNRLICPTLDRTCFISKKDKEVYSSLSEKEKRRLGKAAISSEMEAKMKGIKSTPKIATPPTESFTKKWLDFCVPDSVAEGGEILYNEVSEEAWCQFATLLGADENPVLRLRFLRYDAATRRILIVELPTERHEKVRDCFTMEFAEQGHRRHLDGIGSVTAKFIHKEADGAWRPHGRRSENPETALDANGNAYPTVVLEVGDSESYQQLREDAHHWLSNSTVQIVIIVKITDRKKSLPPRQPRFPLPNGSALDLLLEVYHREDLDDEELGDPRASVYFGNYGTFQQRGPPGCTQAGLPGFLVTLPGRLIYHGDPILNQEPPPAPVANGLTIDLYSLQQVLLCSRSRNM